MVDILALLRKRPAISPPAPDDSGRAVDETFDQLS